MIRIVEPFTLQTILGHQSAGFTLSVYGHVFDEDMDALAERLEEVFHPRKNDVGEAGAGTRGSARPSGLTR